MNDANMIHPTGTNGAKFDDLFREQKHRLDAVYKECDIMMTHVSPLSEWEQFKVMYNYQPALDQIDPSVRVFSLGPMSLQKRANRLVRDAAEQLAPYATNNLPTLIMLDNYRQKGIGLDKHTLGGLFGELQMHLQVDPQTGRTVSENWVRVDDGSPLAGGRNRHVSAIAALVPVERFDTFERDDDFSVERKMKVRIVYNPDAFVPFPPNVFNEPEDEQLN